MKKINTNNINRIWEIDFIRGLAIFLMVLDHLCWDLANLDMFFYNYQEINNSFINNLMTLSSSIFNSNIRYYFHCGFVSIFFLIAGISSSFSKNNMKRGLLLLLTAFVLDLITYIIFYLSNKLIDIRMIFNVLIPLGLGILIIDCINRFKTPNYINLCIGLTIFLLSFIFKLFDKPIYYQEFSIDILFDILISKKAFGSDCFGLLPYIGFIFLGDYLGNVLYKNKKSLLNKLKGKWNHFFCFLGRNTLLIYLTHQVVLVLLIILICLPLGYLLF